jgi:uncharacterized protein (TIGR02246 family)
MDAVITHRATEDVAALIDAVIRAAQAKDIEAFIAHHAPDMVMFDCHSGMQLQGVAAFRAHVAACWAAMPGPFRIEVRDLCITAGDDEVAFCHHLARCGGTGGDGTEQAYWLRATVGLRKIDGHWRIVHAHCSAPFDPETGRALLDLQPEPAAG